MFVPSSSTEKLTGMHENSEKVSVSASPEDVKTAVFNAANVGPVDTSDASTLRFAAVTFSSGLPVLLTAKFSDGAVRLTANSERMVINSMLLKTVKAAISSSST